MSQPRASTPIHTPLEIGSEFLPRQRPLPLLHLPRYFVGTGFPKKDARFLKLKNSPNLHSFNKKR